MNYYFMRVKVHCNIIIHSVTDSDIKDICEKYIEVNMANQVMNITEYFCYYYKF